MGPVPDATAAIAAVVALREQITTAQRSASAIEPADAQQWATLAGQLVQLDEWVHGRPEAGRVGLRDTALVLARNAGARWPHLARESGVPDATLYNRYARARGVHR